MTIVDTSVWVDHFRKENSVLVTLIAEDKVLMHPFVIGEISCGRLQNREKILDALGSLPGANVITFSEILKFIEKNSLFDKGIGFIDIHLLASAYYSKNRLFTLDKNLQRAYERIC